MIVNQKFDREKMTIEWETTDDFGEPLESGTWPVHSFENAHMAFLDLTFQGQGFYVNEKGLLVTMRGQ
jgi:hypothetical protein